MNSGLTLLRAPFRDYLLDRLLPVALLIAGIVGTIPVVRSLHVADVNWCYSYLTRDSYDWINNGLYWAGARVAPSFRPPGLPVLIALLWKAGLLSWLPLLNFSALLATAIILYRLLRRAFPPAVAALASWIFYANDFSQDLAKYVMAEVWATFFIVLAALLFLRAANRPRLYTAVGLSLGVGFLVHYVALVAGMGFVLALFMARRDHLGLTELWAGAAVSCVLPALWLVARSSFYRMHPEGPRVVPEALLRPTFTHVGFFVITSVALLGLPLLPLYLGGFVSALARLREKGRDYRSTILALPIVMGIFFLVIYDWADKRFLFYLFPFLACFLAEGLSRLFAWARASGLRLLAASAYVSVALLWNQIHYPTHGIQYVALTPRDFFDAVGRMKGAPVARLHDRWVSAFADGLFDYRLRPADCRLDGGYTGLLRLRPLLDEMLGRGVAIGLYAPAGWPADYWSCVNRASNILERPVVRPDLAPCSLAEQEVPGTRTLLSVSPYFVVCSS
ncbi:MAG: glycosyltransferase family 39 protein [Thermoanaerobaculia bacterium]